MTNILTAIAVTTIFLSTFSTIARAATEDIVTIDSRPGVTVGFVATPAAGPTQAAAILFAGGHGKLKLWKGRGPRSKNFLVRSRHLIAARGLSRV